MLSKIKDKLSVNGYSYTVEINQVAGEAFVKVCLEDMAPLRIASLFTQLNDWVIGGCGNARIENFDGKIYSAFTVPLDSIYTLTRSLNGAATSVTQSDDISVVRGAMLGCYLNHIDNCMNSEFNITHKMIRIDHAEVIFTDRSGEEQFLEWHISREVIDKSYN